MTVAVDPANAGTKFRCVLAGQNAGAEIESSPALRYAIALARDHSASLSIYVMAPPPEAPFPMDAGSAAAWSEKAQRHCDELGRQTAQRAARLAAAAGLSPITEHCCDPFQRRSARMVQLARVHDLTVLDAAPEANSPGRIAIEDAIFDSGSPVFVVPGAGAPPRPSRVCIAWDGSARAARAVRDALPLLGTARSIEIVTVTGEKDLSRMAPGADLAGYLAAHGIAGCRLEMLAATDRSVAATLLDHCAASGAEMIVMGAFVHSRFRESLLGGVTRSLLDRPALPLLLAH